MRRMKESCMIGIMTLMFWGIMYPQFSLAEETYICLDKKEKEPEKDFFEILDASGEQLIFKSKLWEFVKERVSINSGVWKMNGEY